MPVTTFKPVNEVADAKAARKARQAFYTPLPLVERLVEWADVYPTARTLEPSAGDGRIVHAMRAAGVEQVDFCEIEYGLVGRSQEAGGSWVGGDFLEYLVGEHYDRVVMNPPFKGKTFAKHIEHAWQVLAPGGRVVAVAPTSVEDLPCLDGDSWDRVSLELVRSANLMAAAPRLYADLLRTRAANASLVAKLDSAEKLIRSIQPAPPALESAGLQLIADECRRQVSGKGYDAANDDRHTGGELADAAAVYADAAGAIARGAHPADLHDPDEDGFSAYDGIDATVSWPFERSALKLSADPLRNVVKAGAFCVAEANRLWRAGHRPQKPAKPPAEEPTLPLPFAPPG